MMYSEFTALAKHPITEKIYHEIFEPVYNFHPACTDKQATATLYDIGGAQLFRDMKETAARACALEAEAGELNKRLRKIREEIDSMTPGPDVLYE